MLENKILFWSVFIVVPQGLLRSPRPGPCLNFGLQLTLSQRAGQIMPTTVLWALSGSNLRWLWGASGAIHLELSAYKEYVWNILILQAVSRWAMYLIGQKVEKERGLVLFSITLPFLFIPKGWKAIFWGPKKKLPYVTSCNVKLIIEIYNRAQTIFQVNENRNVLLNFTSIWFGHPFGQLQNKLLL